MAITPQQAKSISKSLHQLQQAGIAVPVVCDHMFTGQLELIPGYVEPQLTNCVVCKRAKSFHKYQDSCTWYGFHTSSCEHQQEIWRN